VTAPDTRDISALAPLVRDGAVSPVDLVRQCLDRISARSGLNAFITVLADRAMEEARHHVREIAGGHYRGPLHGIPVSVKDLVDVAGTPTTSGSDVPPRHPSVDAPVVARLRDAGAILIGKTNLHEFAFGTTGDETAFGPIRNPYDHSRSAGGSSSGAAVALVEGMCWASIGTDTGGSIRIPAAACGTVGLKPAFGEVSTDGVVPLSTTCDHVGPLTRSVADAGLLLNVIGDSPPADPETSDRGRGIGRTLVFGVPTGYLLARLDSEVRAMLDRVRGDLRSHGHTVMDVEIDGSELTPDIYLHVVLPEASEYHVSMLERHPGGYSPGVRLRLEMGRYLLAEDYVRAQRLRQILRASVDRALDGCDALLLPALAIPAPPLGAASVEMDGVKEPVRAAMLRLTQLFNLTGHPAIALPAGRAGSGLPLGLQLVGKAHGTPALLDVAAEVERQMIGGAGSVGGGTG
jgi:aspartyl-tRNA(Asn)/glutamyl-tRNA(Gln) amidotransferase subunit A